MLLPHCFCHIVSVTVVSVLINFAACGVGVVGLLYTQLPLFSSLCLDSAADVREECSRALVTVAQAAVASPAPGNMGLVVRAVEGLAADVSVLILLP